MKNVTHRTDAQLDIYKAKEQLVEKGRQLHNQAIGKMFTMIICEVISVVRKSFGFIVKERKFDYFFGGIPEKK